MEAGDNRQNTNEASGTTGGSNGVAKEYVFNYPWEVVMKGLWLKYPHKELDFVKFARVIDMKVLDDDNMIIKRMLYCKKAVFAWAYIIEEMKMNFKDKICEMKSKVLKKSSLVPTLGDTEFITYRSDGLGRTMYQKFMSNTPSCFAKFADKFNSSFEKGIKIVEENCRGMLNKHEDNNNTMPQ